MNRRIYYITFIVIIKHLSAVTLGPNLLINHDFSTPNIITQNLPYNTFDSPIMGWNCSSRCEILLLFFKYFRDFQEIMVRLLR